MKELLKSKMMILFMVLVLGLTYLSSIQTKKLEDTKQQVAQIRVVSNLQ